ncbi:MAG: hypothetical protein H6719_31045 [Sandaracinaceae bacterium]|nr:hypothetical protein [Sandaracinaceae bacterium]
MRPNVPLLSFLLGLVALPAQAQDGGVPDWVEADPFTASDDDPLGVDRADRLERVAPTRPEEEVERPIPVVRGAVLAAIAGVHETRHDVEVTLDHGLAQVRTEMRFASRARHAAEVRYRLAVPPGASLASLEVCNRHGCRQGFVDASETPLGPYDDAVRARGGGVLPIAHAAIVEDDGGPAVWVRAAPVPPAPPQVRGAADEAWLSIRVTYVAEAPARGGRVRVTLPARGNDNRVAPARIHVSSERLTGATAAGMDAVERSVERAAWEPAEVVARVPAGPVRAEAWSVPCGEGRCARLRVVAPPGEAQAREIVLLLDTSPSTATSARGRVAPTVAALLAALPSSSRLRVAAFAARAQAIVEAPTAPTDISIVEINRALETELGSATRLEAAAELVEPWVRAMHRPLVLVIGDGGLTTTTSHVEALRALRRAGAEVAALDVADRPTTAALQRALEAVDGRWVDAGPEAERAAAGHGMDALTERMAGLLAAVSVPHVRARLGRQSLDLGALRAGEERVWEGPIARGPVSLLAASSSRAVDAPAGLTVALRDRLERAGGLRDQPLRLAALAPESTAAATCSLAQPPPSASAVASARDRLALAETRRCDQSPLPRPSEATAPTETSAPATLHPDTGRSTLPGPSLLRMLRQRIVPAARGCFRDDRRGRPTYQRRAVFVFRVADREVVESSVEGSLAAPLARCLSEAMDTLDIPPFDGAVNVRYPIYTAPRLPPPVLSLDSEIADAVDAVADEE